MAKDKNKAQDPELENVILAQAKTIIELAYTLQEIIKLDKDVIIDILDAFQDLRIANLESDNTAKELLKQLEATKEVLGRSKVSDKAFAEEKQEE